MVLDLCSAVDLINRKKKMEKEDGKSYEESIWVGNGEKDNELTYLLVPKPREIVRLRTHAVTQNHLAWSVAGSGSGQASSSRV